MCQCGGIKRTTLNHCNMIRRNVIHSISLCLSLECAATLLRIVNEIGLLFDSFSFEHKIGCLAKNGWTWINIWISLSESVQKDLDFDFCCWSQPITRDIRRTRRIASKANNKLIHTWFFFALLCLSKSITPGREMAWNERGAEDEVCKKRELLLVARQTRCCLCWLCWSHVTEPEVSKALTAPEVLLNVATECGCCRAWWTLHLSDLDSKCVRIGTRQDFARAL